MKTIKMAAIGLPLVLSACDQGPGATVDDLLAADRAFSEYSEANGPYAAWDKYLADDAVGLPEGQDFSWDKETTLEGFATFPEIATLTWEPLGGGIAESGEMGYTYGRYVVSGQTPEGEPRESHGKYFTVWERQLDGAWLVVLDGGNSNPPPEE